MRYCLVATLFAIAGAVPAAAQEPSAEMMYSESYGAAAECGCGAVHPCCFRILPAIREGFSNLLDCLLPCRRCQPSCHYGLPAGYRPSSCSCGLLVSCRFGHGSGCGCGGRAMPIEMSAPEFEMIDPPRPDVDVEPRPAVPPSASRWIPNGNRTSVHTRPGTRSVTVEPARRLAPTPAAPRAATTQASGATTTGSGVHRASATTAGGRAIPDNPLRR